MRAIVVGAGPTTRELVQGLSEQWEVVLVAPDPDALERTAAERQVIQVLSDDPVTAVLEYLEGADALVAATKDDSVNLDICRIGRDAGLSTISAVAADPEHLSVYRDAGVAAVSPDSLTARRIEITLEPRRVGSAAFADGMAEALEFRIAADSPLRGKALRELSSEAWLIVSILRDGALTIPHGSSVLQEGDLVTVTGAAADYGDIVSTFTAGVATFPADYGSLIAVMTEDRSADHGLLAEAAYFARNTAARGLLLMGPGVAGAEGGWRAAAEELAGDGTEVALAPGESSLETAVAAGAGVALVAPPSGRIWRVQRALTRLVRAGAAAALPLLVARGTYPYGRVVMAAGGGPATDAAIRAAVDLAAGCGGELTGVAAIPPPFMARPDAGAEMSAAIARLRDEAAIQGVAAQGAFEEGNPVRVVERAVGAGRLLVVGSPGRRPTPLTPGPVVHMARRAAASVLVVPAWGPGHRDEAS